MHALTDYCVLVVNERIQIVHDLTGEVEGKGPFEVPVRYFQTMPTSSGDTLVIYWSEGAR